MVKEAQSSMDLCPPKENGDGIEPRGMALVVLKIWGRNCQGNTSWALINTMGDSLEHLTSSMESGNTLKVPLQGDIQLWPKPLTTATEGVDESGVAQSG
ncbi:hypothetical protein BKA81DRAFT_118672 [Phyllosticta paracitricarpa]